MNFILGYAYSGRKCIHAVKGNRALIPQLANAVIAVRARKYRFSRITVSDKFVRETQHQGAKALSSGAHPPRKNRALALGATHRYLSTMISAGDFTHARPPRLDLNRALLAVIAALGLACSSPPWPCKGPRHGACVAPPERLRPQPGADASVDDPGYLRDGGIRTTRGAILVSVDGLGAYYLQRQLDQGKLPNFAALGSAGASTLNARTDYEYTITLPNHTSMLTGRPVSADDDLPSTAHHGWTSNSDVDFSVTLHNDGNPNLRYVASVFDVVHDHGLSTCLYSGKTKFSLFSNSYNAVNGAPDPVGEDNGRNKIDRVAIMDHRTDLVINTALGDLTGGVCDFAFIHIADTDWVGHDQGWGSDGWLSTLDTIDGWIGSIAKFADAGENSDPYSLVVTADHGGVDYGHSDATLPIDYTIPFYIVDPGLPPGANLYAWTGPLRADPGDTRPRYSDPVQPARNADAANLITTLLGLPPVPGSFMHNLLR